MDERENIINESVTPSAVQPSQNNSLKKIVIILCVVCSVIGGLFGGIISGNIVRKKAEKETTTASAVVQNSETTTVAQNTTAAPTTSQTTTAQATTAATTQAATTQQNINSGVYTSSDDKPSLGVSLKAKDIYKNNVDSVVSIEVRNAYSSGSGTGFIISEQGYIVTNYHVVEGSGNVYVTLHDESTYTAKVIGYEESNDIAVIKIEPEGKIESLVYGKSSSLSVGDDVYVIGNPLGDLTFTLTRGVVSALNRLIDTGSGFSINMFQTDAAINSGNSGGPVFDEHGFVVGIASAKYASSSIEGLSFCVPIDDVRSMIDEIINKGYVSGKPLIGVSVCDREVVSYGFIQSARSINGAKIVAVGKNTAAEKAGLLVNDIIISADGKTISSVSQLRTVLSDYRSGDIIILKINRNGAYTDVSLILGEYEPSSPRTDYSYVYDL